jgi:uncharacterized alpha-E superfamily protein
MLSRSAQGLYWMGRYLERAERLCRLLQLQTEALVDRPVREIHFGWMRIYGSMNEEPPVGGLQMGSDDFTLADSYTLADHLTFERTNPDSVWSCFSLARENARQMRHCISAEMWTSLNLAYLKFQRVSLQDIWMSAPESFYSEVATEINTFSGVAEATMYRDDGWHFMQLGYLIERAQLSASLLLAQIAGSADEEEADWTSLLRVYHAVEAYNRRYGVEVHSDQVLDLLVTDPMLPNSLCRSLDVTAEQLAGLGPGPDAGSSAAARRLAGRLGALIHYEWPDREDHEESLLQVNAYCRELHNLVNATYFEYDL